MTEYDCSGLKGLKKFICQGAVPTPSGLRKLHPNEQARYMALFQGKTIPQNELSPSVKRLRYRQEKIEVLSGAEPQDLIGVGTTLHNFLSKFGITEIPGCSCRANADKMNYRGMAWCEDNKKTITEWLVTNAKERLVKVSSVAKLIPTTLKTGIIEASALAILNKAIKDTKKQINSRKTELPITVAVTTAARGGDVLLGRCVQSILDSGFQEVTVYAEPDAKLNIEESERVQIVIRKTKLGAWHNWMQTLDDCLQKDPNTILIVQDDCVFCKGVYDYLKASLWPSYDCAAIQLCCSTYYKQMVPGFNVMPQVGMVGAWATVMHRYYAQQILDYGREYGWRGHHRRTETDPVKMKAIDDYIGYAARQVGAKCYINYPSIVLHDADISSLNHGNSKGSRNNRATRSWIGENSVALDHVPLWKERVQFQD